MKKQIIASAISAFVGVSPIVAQSQTSEPLDERGYVIPDMNIVINPRDKTIVIPFEIVSGAAITYTNVGHNIYNCRSKILIVHRPDQFP